MRKRNIILYLVLGLFLTGCFQSTAMVGPALTLASTGNISQAGISFLTNKAIKDETGMNTLEFVSYKIDNVSEEERVDNNFNINDDFILLVQHNSNDINNINGKEKADDNYNLNDDFILLVQNNFEKTRKIILTQNQSKTPN